MERNQRCDQRKGFKEANLLYQPVLLSLKLLVIQARLKLLVLKMPMVILFPTLMLQLQLVLTM
ncbi:hypothetical protein B1745_07470 (plasmid) [Lactobacillus amylolyticus]|nr:hypothetical protein B1745_07470 [Lactobacillus amylolyticus]